MNDSIFVLKNCSTSNLSCLVRNSDDLETVPLLNEFVSLETEQGIIIVGKVVEVLNIYRKKNVHIYTLDCSANLIYPLTYSVLDLYDKCST